LDSHRKALRQSAGVDRAKSKSPRFDPLVNSGQHGFDAVKLLSGRCGSSLPASAIRYTEGTKECVAVIVSHHGLVEFMTALKWRDRLATPAAGPDDVLHASLGSIERQLADIYDWQNPRLSPTVLKLSFTRAPT
jgi:hypothetical protein